MLTYPNTNSIQLEVKLGPVYLHTVITEDQANQIFGSLTNFADEDEFVTYVNGDLSCDVCIEITPPDVVEVNDD